MPEEKVSVADEVWIATALLHREHPDRMDFEKSEIIERLSREGLVEPLRPGVSIHISSHAVASKKPQPNEYRMLVETERGRRRLFREGDYFHPERKGKQEPSAPEIPRRYWPLLTWYQQWKKSKKHKAETVEDPLLDLAGTWTFGSAENYLRDLRKDWE